MHYGTKYNVIFIEDVYRKIHFPRRTSKHAFRRNKKGKNQNQQHKIKHALYCCKSHVGERRTGKRSAAHRQFRFH